MPESLTQSPPSPSVAPARLSDRALVSRAARDPSAFSEIVHRYREPLRRHAAGYVGDSDAEDVVQQAFISASLAFTREPDREIELRPWLYRVTTNAAIDHQRARAARPPIDSSDDERAFDQRVGSSVDPHDVIVERDAVRALTRRMGALAPNQRRAATARFMEGRSHGEIAADLGVSAGAARELIHRARRNLRDAIPALSPWPLFTRLKETLAGAFAGAASVPAAKVAVGIGVVALAAGGGVAAVDTSGESEPADAATPVAPLAAVSALAIADGAPPSSGNRRRGGGTVTRSSAHPTATSSTIQATGDADTASAIAAATATVPDSGSSIAGTRDATGDLGDQLGIGKTLEGLGLPDLTEDLALPDLSEELGVQTPKLPSGSGLLGD